MFTKTQGPLRPEGTPLLVSREGQSGRQKPASDEGRRQRPSERISDRSNVEAHKHISMRSASVHSTRKDTIASMLKSSILFAQRSKRTKVVHLLPVPPVDLDDMTPQLGNAGVKMTPACPGRGMSRTS